MTLKGPKYLWSKTSESASAAHLDGLIVNDIKTLLIVSVRKNDSQTNQYHCS